MGSLAVALVLLFSSAAEAAGKCGHSDDEFRCVKYVSNYDGDTITFDIPRVHPLLGKQVSVRIAGIDTPEITARSRCEKEKARQARDLVESLISRAKRVNLEGIQRDKYFRILADVKADGRSVGQLLLEMGLAYPYDGGKKKRVNWCRPSREIASENASSKKPR